MLASDGNAKRVDVSQFPKQGRYGQGVVAWKLPTRVSLVGMVVGKGTARATLFLNRLAPKVVRLDSAPKQGRTARGKVIQELKSGDQIVCLVTPWESLRLQARAKPVATKRTRRGTTTSTRQHKTSAQSKTPGGGIRNKSTPDKTKTRLRTTTNRGGRKKTD